MYNDVEVVIIVLTYTTKLKEQNYFIPFPKIFRSKVVIAVKITKR